MTQGSSTEIVIERVFDAPRELVWKAWTDPEHVAKWCGPQGMKTRVDELDFRPGGNWVYVMLAPDGSEYPQRGTFREIVPPEKIVTTAVFEYGEAGSSSVVMTYIFEDMGDKTKMTMTHVEMGVEYSEEQRMGVIAGWNSNFDSLVDYLPSLL